MHLYHLRNSYPTTLIDILKEQMESNFLDLRDHGEVITQMLIMEAYNCAIL